jgi:hypothetical protein
LQTKCFNDLEGQSAALGCAVTNPVNATCLCQNVNFGYGIRDCASQACGATEAAAVVAFGNEYCVGELKKMNLQVD